MEVRVDASKSNSFLLSPILWNVVRKETGADGLGRKFPVASDGRASLRKEGALSHALMLE